MKKIIVLLNLFFISLSFTIMAQTTFDNSHEKLLAEVISEPEGGKIHQFFGIFDDFGNIISLERRSQGDYSKFSLNDIIQREVTIVGMENRSAVLIHCPNCSPEYGGEVEIKYLYNGVSMHYRSFFMNFERHDNDWNLTTQDRKTIIRTLRILPRKIMGQLIGIKEIVVNR